MKRKTSARKSARALGPEAQFWLLAPRVRALRSSCENRLRYPQIEHAWPIRAPSCSSAASEDVSSEAAARPDVSAGIKHEGTDSAARPASAVSSTAGQARTGKFSSPDDMVWFCGPMKLRGEKTMVGRRIERTREGDNTAWPWSPTDPLRVRKTRKRGGRPCDQCAGQKFPARRNASISVRHERVGVRDLCLAPGTSCASETMPIWVTTRHGGRGMVVANPPADAVERGVRVHEAALFEMATSRRPRRQTATTENLSQSSCACSIHTRRPLPPLRWRTTIQSVFLQTYCCLPNFGRSGRSQERLDQLRPLESQKLTVKNVPQVPILPNWRVFGISFASCFLPSCSL